MKRYALVTGLAVSPEKVAPYLPSNYQVLGTYDWPRPWGSDPAVVIQGEDRGSGFTLDGYVIPRLASGMMACQEIDLSNAALKDIPCN